MILEGVVTNVAAFGAFVDVGVHQDGLVHVSALANRFVKDPHEVVKPGQIVRVKVLEVDVKRQRIALSMRLDEVPGNATGQRMPRSASNGGQGDRNGPGRPRPQGGGLGKREPQPAGTSALAQAMAMAKARK